MVEFEIFGIAYIIGGPLVAYQIEYIADHKTRRKFSLLEWHIYIFNSNLRNLKSFWVKRDALDCVGIRTRVDSIRLPVESSQPYHTNHTIQPAENLVYWSGIYSFLQKIFKFKFKEFEIFCGQRDAFDCGGIRARVYWSSVKSSRPYHTNHTIQPAENFVYWSGIYTF